MFLEILLYILMVTAGVSVISLLGAGILVLIDKIKEKNNDHKNN